VVGPQSEVESLDQQEPVLLAKAIGSSKGITKVDVAVQAVYQGEVIKFLPSACAWGGMITLKSPGKSDGSKAAVLIGVLGRDGSLEFDRARLTSFLAGAGVFVLFKIQKGCDFEYLSFTTKGLASKLKQLDGDKTIFVPFQFPHGRT